MDMSNTRRTSRLPNQLLWASLIAMVLMPALANAEEDPVAAALASPQVALDTVWVVVAGVLVFFMNAGFALLETGFCRAKNAVNILAKNFTVAAWAGLAFFFVGFGLMFADGNGFVGMGGFMLSGADNSPLTGDAYEGIFSSLNWTAVPLEVKYFFQACFAMAAASIVSGAVAERIRFEAYVVFSIVLVALIYPITGHWIWGGGWLADLSFLGIVDGEGNGLAFSDFAGSTAVHSIGGWAALVGAALVGPRLGKYGANGKPRPIPGHSMALATIGGFILWIGWFGFNAGSTMGAVPADIGIVVVTTLLASMAGIAGAMITSYIKTRGFDLGMMINGSLAGLVGITAPCAAVSPGSAVIIGLIAGFIVVLSVDIIDRIGIDDPVGAVSVHLVCGMWGTLAVGLFAVDGGLITTGSVGQTLAQLVGIVAVGAFVAISSLVVWSVIKVIIGMRVPEEDELVGLDISEMKMRAYPGEQLGGSRSSAAPEAAMGSPVAKESEAAI